MMDLKKLRKGSSKKFIKGGLGFFLSPRENGKNFNQELTLPVKDTSSATNLKKSNDWNCESSKLPKYMNIDEKDKDFIDDIPAIPSLDDFPNDITNEIAKAPLVGVKQIATIKEVENDILKNSLFANFEEVNLQVLIRGLHSESLLNEPDVPWSPESLFYDVVSRINQRKL